VIKYAIFLMGQLSIGGREKMKSDTKVAEKLRDTTIDDEK